MSAGTSNINGSLTIVRIEMRDRSSSTKTTKVFEGQKPHIENLKDKERALSIIAQDPQLGASQFQSQLETHLKTGEHQKQFVAFYKFLEGRGMETDRSSPKRLF